MHTYRQTNARAHMHTLMYIHHTSNIYSTYQILQEQQINISVFLYFVLLWHEKETLLCREIYANERTTRVSCSQLHNEILLLYKKCKSHVQ